MVEVPAAGWSHLLVVLTGRILDRHLEQREGGQTIGLHFGAAFDSLVTLSDDSSARRVPVSGPAAGAAFVSGCLRYDVTYPTETRIHAPRSLGLGLRPRRHSIAGRGPRPRFFAFPFRGVFYVLVSSVRQHRDRGYGFREPHRLSWHLGRLFVKAPQSVRWEGRGLTRQSFIVQRLMNHSYRMLCIYRPSMQRHAQPQVASARERCLSTSAHDSCSQVQPDTVSALL